MFINSVFILKIRKNFSTKVSIVECVEENENAFQFNNE